MGGERFDFIGRRLIVGLPEYIRWFGNVVG